MNCPKCRIAGTILGGSKTKTMWRCPRGHMWDVPVLAVCSPDAPTPQARPARTLAASQQPSVFDQILDTHPAPRHHPTEDTEAASGAEAQRALGGIRRELLELAGRLQGVTGDEAVAALGMDDRQTSVRPALSQLVKMGLVEKSRMRRANRRGFSEIVYRRTLNGAKHAQDDTQQ